MFTESDILALSDAFAAATGLPETTISSRIFDDGKRLSAIRGGKGITLRRANEALRWFAANWPDGVEWPGGVVRPAALEVAQ